MTTHQEKKKKEKLLNNEIKFKKKSKYIKL